MPIAAEALAQLPKVDLHVHLAAAMPVPVACRLAAKYGSEVVPHDPADFPAMLRFADFADFSRAYIAINNLVRSAEDVVAVVDGFAAQLAADAVAYAEVTVAPLNHINAGLPRAELAAGMTAGLARARARGVELRWCVAATGRGGVADAFDALEFVAALPAGDVVSFGLGGPEIERKPFAPVFDAARAAGLHAVPHAGETRGPESIWSALDDLGAERIGHGIRAVDDEHLVERLVADGITLEICPTSNVVTGLVPSLAEHPIRVLRERGVRVVVNSDDPTLFGTSVSSELSKVCKALDLDLGAAISLQSAAVDASFMPERSKQALLSALRSVGAHESD
jgi:aminodeoxyfutalosine deaminase